MLSWVFLIYQPSLSAFGILVIHTVYSDALVGFCCVQMQWFLQSTSYNVLVNTSAFLFLQLKPWIQRVYFPIVFQTFISNLDHQFVKSLSQFLIVI